MTLRDYTNDAHWKEWLASRFEKKQSIYIRIDLIPCRNNHGSKQWLSDDIINQTARRFRNKLNHHYYGKASRRFGKGLDIAIHLHLDPHKHFHMVIEKPENESIIKFKSVVEGICLVDAWMKPFPYFETTEDHHAALSYNGRHGSDSLILF